MRTSNRLCQLVEERLLDLCKLGRIHDLKDVFDFIQEHDFLGAVDFGPVPQQTENDLEILVITLCILTANLLLPSILNLFPETGQCSRQAVDGTC